MKKTLLIATALTASAYTFSSGASQEAASLLESLPAEVQKDVEEIRASCRSVDIGGLAWNPSSRSSLLECPAFSGGGRRGQANRRTAAAHLLGRVRRGHHVRRNLAPLKKQKQSMGHARAVLWPPGRLRPRTQDRPR
jgi:hypothetical protein